MSRPLPCTAIQPLNSPVVFQRYSYRVIDVSDGWFQNSDAVVFPANSCKPFGAAGTPVGVARSQALGKLVPSALLARTRNSYSFSLVSPVIVAVVAAPTECHTWSEGLGRLALGSR